MSLAVQVWVVLSALLAVAGWGLSLLGQLSPVGFAAVLLLAVLSGFAWWRSVRPGARISGFLRRCPRRFSRLAPACFLAMAVLGLVAGVLYPPANFDSLSYRLPRLMHWLDAGGWHWIHTSDVRMNVICCNTEWLWAPFLMVARSDRGLFLVNWITFLLLPGLLFSLFRRVGVRPRVAWWWMWLLPAAFGYALQTSETSNDIQAVVYALAAVDGALRARSSKRPGDLWVSLLALGFLTGLKQTNLLFVPLWAVAAFPAWSVAWKRPVVSLGVAAVALACSCFPTVCLNALHAGSWKGFPAELRLEPESPFWGVVGNAFALPIQNLLPPFFPWADSWNAMMLQFLETPFGAHFRSFEHFGRLEGGPIDGLGLFLCLLIGFALILSRKAPASRCCPQPGGLLLKWIPWLLLLVFMAKVGVCSNTRFLAPLYPFLMVAVLVGPAQEWVVRQRCWRVASAALLACTLITLVSSRARPLFPAETMTVKLQHWFPNRFTTRVRQAFQGGAALSRYYGQVASDVPHDTRVLGYATWWGPLEPAVRHARPGLRVVRMTPSDTSAGMTAVGVRYVLVDLHALREERVQTIAEWCQKHGAELVSTRGLGDIPQIPPLTNYLVCLRRNQ